MSLKAKYNYYIFSLEFIQFRYIIGLKLLHFVPVLANFGPILARKSFYIPPTVFRTTHNYYWPTILQHFKITIFPSMVHLLILNLLLYLALSSL